VLVKVIALLTAVIFCIPALASAQSHRAGDAFVAARAGANLVGNTYRVRQSKAVPGFGASGGFFLSRYWATELEVWSRSSNPDSSAGPEMLYSLSAERMYARIGIQPYLAGGVALLRSTERDQGKQSTRVQVQVTAGVRVPLVSRLAVDLDLRGNGGGSTMIVRPTLAAVYFFQ
jgi:opacity protein-like surface antigen